MASELLTVDVQNIPEVTAWTVGMLERAQDMTPVWEAGHRAFMLEMLQQFATEGSHLNGGEWESLSEEYAAWKRKHYPEQPILQLSGDLLMSLVNADDINHVSIITPEKATFGTQVPYAIYHQDGKGVPQRRIIKTRDVFRRLLFRASIAWIVGGRQLRDVTGDAEAA